MINRLICSTFFVLLSAVAVGKPDSVRMAGVIIPAGFKILMEVKGDLDNDGIPELVVVFDTPKEVELGTERQLWVYKQSNAGWKVWHKSIGPVLASKDGGMLGDPLVSVIIARGCILIYHEGGTAPGWQYIHRYRYQNNNWYLIGANISFRAVCLLSNYDYNLSTGKIKVNIGEAGCDDQPEMVKNIKSGNLRLSANRQNLY